GRPAAVPLAGDRHRPEPRLRRPRHRRGDGHRLRPQRPPGAGPGLLPGRRPPRRALRRRRRAVDADPDRRRQGGTVRVANLRRRRARRRADDRLAVAARPGPRPGGPGQFSAPIGLDLSGPPDPGPGLLTRTPMETSDNLPPPAAPDDAGRPPWPVLLRRLVIWGLFLLLVYLTRDFFFVAFMTFLFS